MLPYIAAPWILWDIGIDDDFHGNSFFDHWEFMMIFMGFPRKLAQKPFANWKHLELNGPRFQRIRGLRSGN